MTIAMTLLSREPTEMLEAQLRFHFAAGVDVVLVANPEVVPESFRSDERVRVVSGSLAAAADRADWVVPAGPAEFWWPRGGSLAEVLGKIPRDYDVVQALVRRFLRVQGAGGDELSTQIYRLQPQAALEDQGGTAGPERRIIHRGAIDVAGYDGGLVPSRLRPLRGWYPVEVLSFSGGLAASQERIDAGLQEGVVEEDTRVRDALSTIADGGGSLRFERPSVVDNALFAVDASVLGEADAFRLRDELDELERRLAKVEDNVALRAARKLQALVRRSPPS